MAASCWDRALVGFLNCRGTPLRMRNLASNLLQSRLFKALTLTLLRTRTITPQMGIFPFDFSIYLFLSSFYYFIFFLQLRVTQLDIEMQNPTSFGAPMIASVGQGRIYSVHLQLARGVEPRGALGWPEGVGVVVMLRPKVTCSAPPQARRQRQCCK